MLIYSIAKNNSGEKKIISFEGYDFNAYFIWSQKN